MMQRLSRKFIDAALLVLASAGLAIIASLTFGPTQSTSALSGRDFNAGYIISDAVFYDQNAMNVGDIQSFLNSKVPSCDTNGTRPASDQGRPDLTHAQYAAMRGWHGPPYTCMRDYSQPTPQMEAASGLCNGLPATGSSSAAQIIYNIAQACHINPRVLLILLQKEQSLVLDTWPLNSQYTKATGFACPDTNPPSCNPEYGGYFYQVYYAARQFQIYKKNPNNYNYVAGRNNNIYYHQSLGGCGSSQVFIQNQATAALYIYTPYQPNAAALNNLYGTGDDCSAYGNRNFWRLFNDWFGSPTILAELNSRYDALAAAGFDMGGPTDGGYCIDDAHTSCWQGFRNGYIVYNKGAGAWESYGATRTRWGQMGYERSNLGYPSGPIFEIKNGSNVVTGYYQPYQNGYIVGPVNAPAWESAGSIRTVWANAGFEGGRLGYPSGPIYPAANGGYYQQYQNGYVVGSNTTGWWESRGPIRERWGQLGYEAGRLGYPTANLDCSLPSSGCKQDFQSGVILWTSSTGAREVMGAIGGRYYQLGAHTGSLGYPTSNEACGTIKDNGCFQVFQNGYVVGSPASGWWESRGNIRERWGQLGFEAGRLGYPISNLDCSLPSSGCKQDFQGGTVLWSSGTGAWQVWGAIGGRYYQLGAQGGSLGYPTGTEACGTIKDNGCFQVFQNGYIAGSPASGWWESRGPIRERWAQLSYENGRLGYPIGQIYSTSTGGSFQPYQGGYLIGKSGTGYWESYGDIRSKWAELGYEAGTLGYPTGAVTCSAGTCSQTYERGTIYANASSRWHTSI